MVSVTFKILLAVVVASSAMPKAEATFKGACCKNGECSRKNPFGCVFSGGFFQGLGTTCDNGMCDTTLGHGNGACCKDGECKDTSFLACLLHHGNSFAHQQTCSAAPCEADVPATVACCHSDYTCTDVSPADCTSAGGTPGATDSMCMMSSCAPPDPTGSCCVPGGACFNDATATECMDAGGAFVEDGVCEDETCECSIGECPSGTVCQLGQCLDAETTDKTYVEREHNGNPYLAGEAEVYSARCFHESTTEGAGNYFWRVLGDRPADTCESEYLEVRPDGDNGAQQPDVIAPISDYKLIVLTPGTYRLWVRAADNGGTADSFYAEVVELRENEISPLWWRIAPNTSAFKWLGRGGLEKTNAGGGDSDMYFVFANPGQYTLRFRNREDGTPVDKWALIRVDEDLDEAGFAPTECSDLATCLDEGEIPNDECPVELVDCDTTTVVASSSSMCVTLQFQE